MALGFLTRAANLNEITYLKEILHTLKIAERTPVKLDKGYKSKKNRDLSKERKPKDHIMKKAKKNGPRTTWEVKFNILMSNTKYKIEQNLEG